MIIGLTGKARSGKDTVGRYLFRKLDAQTYAFASPIKAACREIFGWTHDHTDGELKEKVDPLFGVSPRQAMQRLGTEWGRDCIDKEMWLKCAAQRLCECKNSFFIITDVRFDNEAEWVRTNGGLIIHIERDSAEVVNSHASEKGVTKMPRDALIKNNGTLSDLYREVELVAELRICMRPAV